jgi:chaperonin GroEL
MIEKGMEKVKSGINPMQLKREIESSLASISFDAKKIKTDEELFNVANISMETPKVAKIVADAVKKAGEDGIVLVEESNQLDIQREDVDGMKFERGFITPYMVTDPEKMTATLEDVAVLVTDKQIYMNKDIMLLLEEMHKKGAKQLFMICAELGGEALSTIIANRQKGIFHVVAVQKPFNNDMLSDIALLTGAQVLSEQKGVKEFSANDVLSLGFAKKVIVDPISTIIIKDGDRSEEVNKRIAFLKSEIKKSEYEFQKGQLRERLAKLSSGIVTLKIGAPTESEMKYLKLKVDDAVSATRAAMEEGIVAGGGRFLYDVSLVKAKNHGDEVVKYACGQPIRRIIENAGYDSEEILPTLKDGEVWNASTYMVSSDPFADGIIDPVKVERCSVKNAASLACSFLSAGCAIVDVPEKKIYTDK